MAVRLVRKFVTASVIIMEAGQFHVATAVSASGVSGAGTPLKSSFI